MWLLWVGVGVIIGMCGAALWFIWYFSRDGGGLR